MADTSAREAARPGAQGRIAAALFALCLAATCPAAELAGRVIRVADGDTITVLDHGQVEHKVRLSGIDAPEKNQPFGTLAKSHLSALVHGKTVVVVWHKRDRYRRIIGQVLVTAFDCANAACANGADAGLAQISSGYAWHYKQYEYDQTPKQRKAYALAEHQAQAGRHGLWIDLEPLPPWEFRHRQRGHASSMVHPRS